MLENFHHAFDHLIVLDVETTGLNPKTDEIIELGGICLQLTATGPQPAAELNMLIHLSPGRELTPFITDLTGISPSCWNIRDWTKPLRQNALPGSSM